jgi:hypothetical protein
MCVNRYQISEISNTRFIEKVDNLSLLSARNINTLQFA